MLNEAEMGLLKTAMRMNMIVMAIAFGLLGGSILWLSTVILLLRGGYDVGSHLSLLSVFLPGYSVTWSGAWVGLWWGFILRRSVGSDPLLELREHVARATRQPACSTLAMPPPSSHRRLS